MTQLYIPETCILANTAVRTSKLSLHKLENIHKAKHFWEI
jgi:hypothetical protein